VAVKLKLKATVVRSLGDSAFTDTISSESYQHTIAGDRPDDVGEREDIVLPDIGDVVGGQYRLVSRLGEGMFGSVYVAERTDVKEHRVALKMINRAVYGDRDNQRELVMLAAATHPHIVELKDHGTTSDYIWLTMALYEGETLAARLTRGTLDLEEAHRIFVPIAQGVAALHARGLRHQDIKPENIYLADFAGHLLEHVLQGLTEPAIGLGEPRGHCPPLAPLSREQEAHGEDARGIDLAAPRGLQQLLAEIRDLDADHRLTVARVGAPVGEHRRDVVGAVGLEREPHVAAHRLEGVGVMGRQLQQVHG